MPIGCMCFDIKETARFKIQPNLLFIEYFKLQYYKLIFTTHSYIVFFGKFVDNVCYWCLHYCNSGFCPCNSKVANPFCTYTCSPYHCQYLNIFIFILRFDF